jgi:NAD(P)H-hydrate epimerase
MSKIVSVEQMRAMEKEADHKGVSFDRMMDYAGGAVFREAIKLAGPLAGRRVVLLCGSGNNGGDGLAAALLFAKAGADTRVFLAGERGAREPRRQAVSTAGIPVEDATTAAGRDRLQESLADADLVVDAVLGTGTRLPLRQPAADILRLVSAGVARSGRRPAVLAVDCPSGVDCDGGEAAPETPTADLTVTFGAAKRGLLRFPAAEYVGRLVVADIGLPPDLPSQNLPGADLATPKVLRPWLPARPRNSHKGTFGRVLVIGGSVNYPGAPILAGMGAYRTGAGLVSLAVPATVQTAGIPLLAEATWIVLPEDFGVIGEAAVEIALAETAASTTVVLGPGIGREKATAAFVREFLQEGQGRKNPIGFGISERPAVEAKQKLPPMVIDADALKIMREVDGWAGLLPEGSVLTPHPGEMEILTGLPKEEILKDREGIAARFAREWKVNVVLKGAFSVIAAPDGAVVVEPFATPALARAGTGDVLAGVIGGLMAQGMPGWRAAVLGAYLHGRAGELAAQDLRTSAAVLAGDVARLLAASIAELEGRI